ncbi:MAG: GNAT family N-acetyltransferase [Spirochaetales bacterium]|nr:GNAT family N-acetyltransferase [Spirochaetales bacterium]
MSSVDDGVATKGLRVVRLDLARREIGRRRLEAGLADICHRTGLYGRDLAGTGLFDDRKLFALFFILYYPRFEPSSGFVALEGEGKGARVRGYCVGTPDSARQARSVRRMAPAILLRMAFAALFHPESFRVARRLVAGAKAGTATDPTWKDYPAHLHINVDPCLQRGGAGGRLIEAFEERMRELKAPGIQLHTSTENEKAIPFYRKRGYEVLSEGAPGHSLWPGFPDARDLAFCKRLSGADETRA